MEWRSNPSESKTIWPSRRRFLIGSGVGGALVIGYAIWPRRYLAHVAALPGETALSGYLKIGGDGHVTVIVPQIELGQASTTLLPQIVADELGAEWRSIAVEPAPLNRFYADTLFAEGAGWSDWFALSAPAPLQVTEEGLSLSAFADTMRQAAAGARELLIQAAARRWGVEPSTCEAFGGFVTRGKQKLRFGELVAEAARLSPPDPVPPRQGASNRLIDTSLPRLDAPAKVDGSVNYAADIRLPDMVFATVRQGPLGETKLLHYNADAARKIAGAVNVIALPNALACVAHTSWAAAKMLDAAAPSFTTAGALVDDAQISRALNKALKADSTRAITIGDVDAAMENGHAESATYRVGLLPHVALEPLSATARYEKGVLEIWTAAQIPEASRSAAARGSGVSERNIIIHSVMGGGSFGRRFEVDAVEQVAAIVMQIKQPVQLFWSRGQDMMHDRFGGGVAAKLTAQVLPDGRIHAWTTALAAAAPMAELRARTLGGQSSDAARRGAEGSIDDAIVDSAQPFYAVPNIGITAHPAKLGVPTGPIRGGAALSTCFFNESFINELSAKTGVEPFSFRMALLGSNARLAQCLAKAAALGGWSGGAQGSNQGIACHMTSDGCIAVMVEAKLDDTGRVSVSKITAVADIGQLVNPDVMRQQIEGGLMFGLGIAVSAPVQIKRGVAGPIRMGALQLPRLADTPEVVVELIPSNAPSADAWNIAAPPVAPAIAGALFAGSGKRFRNLPFSSGA